MAQSVQKCKSILMTGRARQPRASAAIAIMLQVVGRSLTLAEAPAGQEIEQPGRQLHAITCFCCGWFSKIRLRNATSSQHTAGVIDPGAAAAAAMIPKRHLQCTETKNSSSNPFSYNLSLQLTDVATRVGAHHRADDAQAAPAGYAIKQVGLRRNVIHASKSMVLLDLRRPSWW